MERFRKKGTATGIFYAEKKPTKTWEANVDNIVISNLVKTKTNFKYLIGTKFDKAIRPIVLIIPTMRGDVKTFKVKEGDEDKNNKLMYFRIDDEKLLKKYKAIQTKIEVWRIELNTLTVYDDRYIKTKIRTYGDKVYNNFRGLNVPEDNIFKFLSLLKFLKVFICIDSLLAYKNKYCLEVYLDSCAYKVVNKQMINYDDENLSED